MNPRRSLLALGALGSAIALSGCVAAVIPLAAGTLMATSSRLDGGKATGSPAVAGLAPPAAVVAAVEPAEATLLAPAALAPGVLPDPTARLAGDGVGISRGALPAPALGGDRIVEGFRAHALDQAQRNPRLTPRDSALLAEPGLLRPERMDCRDRPPAVIVDLDPGKESFDPLAPVAGNPSLAAALAELREREVTVFWTSHLGEGFAESLRSVLADTGLDPQGQDRLLLLRTLDQRKHTRRTEIAQTHCVVAMLGDERADFDELFHYLKQPETALRLDAMLGSGWFLADPLPAQIIGEE